MAEAVQFEIEEGCAFHYYGFSIPPNIDIKELMENICQYYRKNPKIDKYLHDQKIDDLEDFYYNFPEDPHVLDLPFVIIPNIGNPLKPLGNGAIVFVKTHITHHENVFDPDDFECLEKTIHENLYHTDPHILDYLFDILKVPYGWHIAISMS